MSHCYGMLLRIFKFLGLFQFFHSEKTKRSYVTLLLQISWRQNNQKDSSLQPPVQKRQLPETWQEGNAFPTPQTVGSARTGHWRSQTNTFGETLGSSYCFPPVLATTAGFCSGVGLVAWGFLTAVHCLTLQLLPICHGKGAVQCWALFSTQCWGSDSTVGENQSVQLGKEAWCWYKNLM